MALFKIFRGTDISKLTNPANEEYIPLKDGYCYFDTTTGLFFIDAEVVKEDGTTEIVRAPINANRITITNNFVANFFHVFIFSFINNLNILLIFTSFCCIKEYVF